MRTKIEHDALTGEIIERPYTDEENEQADLDEQNAPPLVIAPEESTPEE
jgi:hypothetical protein